MVLDPGQFRRRFKEARMPLVDIQLIKGVFTQNQKNAMLRKVTDAMVEVEGEPMRPVTWVRVQEIESGEWAIGGTPLTAADGKAMAGKT
jgi:4-oxalocrotonate tautomerase